MTLAQIDKFRLCTIFHLVPEKIGTQTDSLFEEQPVSYGLALEVRCSEPGEKESYIVIAFIKPQRHDDPRMETVDRRFFGWVKTQDDLDTVRFLYDYGVQRIAEAIDDDED